MKTNESHTRRLGGWASAWWCCILQRLGCIGRGGQMPRKVFFAGRHHRLSIGRLDKTLFCLLRYRKIWKTAKNLYWNFSYFNLFFFLSQKRSPRVAFQKLLSLFSLLEVRFFDCAYESYESSWYHAGQSISDRYDTEIDERRCIQISDVLQVQISPCSSVNRSGTAISHWNRDYNSSILKMTKFIIKFHGAEFCLRPYTDSQSQIHTQTTDHATGQTKVCPKVSEG